MGDTNWWIDTFGLTSWSEVLRKLNIEQPTGLYKPHGHHIVFRGAFDNKPNMSKFVKGSQDILENFGIGINDPSNLMWASNGDGTHTLPNVKKVYKALNEAQDDLLKKIAKGELSYEQVQAMMEGKLQETGQKVFGNC